MNIAEEIASHPVVTVMAGLTTTTIGALNNFAADLPIVHDFLGILTMIAGLIACGIGIAVQIRQWHLKDELSKTEHLKQIKLQQEIDRGNNVTK